MCKIYATRRSSRFVYIELDDEVNDYYGVKKITPEKFEFARRFGNDFLNTVSQETTTRRDESDAIKAMPFRDNLIKYSARF